MCEMSYWLDRGRPLSSSDSPERRALVLPFRVPRSYGSIFPYYRFMRETLSEPMPNENVFMKKKTKLGINLKTKSGLVVVGGEYLVSGDGICLAVVRSAQCVRTPSDMLPSERIAHRTASAIFKRLSLAAYSTYSLVRIGPRSFIATALRPPSLRRALNSIRPS
ncbi:uncharacterized protein LOC123879081 [Maniola jurtina]|uniref:uncharacterized protein LOC123879081 n=1 Tax=Maniola jurtina TaxID=191418 RepID=UPI001E68E33B|nr:uncharacterized protein LOC123879081 [Maniola jurtina]